VSPSADALMLYIAWTLAMGLLLVSHRGLFMMAGKRKINQFSADNKGLSEFGERMARVHANCIETLPIATSLLLYAIATHQTAVTDGLAPWLLGLRILQSLVHMSGTREWQVWLRFSCFFAQVAICAYWVASFLALR